MKPIGANSGLNAVMGTTGNKSWAFTLMELLVVISIIGILAALLLPILGKAKGKATGVSCLGNLKQMELGWHLYSDDHQAALAPNYSGETAGKNSRNPAWVAGWMLLDDKPGDKTDSTNTDMLVGTSFTKFGSIGQYTKDPHIYRCPSDRSTITIAGARYPRVRSVSMNNYINGSGKYIDQNYLNVHRMSDFDQSSPANTWVFLDEREDSINNGYFAVVVYTNYAIVDYPASYHNGASGVTFADGHAEFHKWVEPTTTPPVQPGVTLNIKAKPTSSTDQDMKWLVERTTVKLSNPH